jgi:hypothetical protein
VIKNIGGEIGITLRFVELEMHSAALSMKPYSMLGKYFLKSSIKLKSPRQITSDSIFKDDTIAKPPALPKVSLEDVPEPLTISKKGFGKSRKRIKNEDICLSVKGSIESSLKDGEISFTSLLNKTTLKSNVSYSALYHIANTFLAYWLFARVSNIKLFYSTELSLRPITIIEINTRQVNAMSKLQEIGADTFLVIGPNIGTMCKTVHLARYSQSPVIPCVVEEGIDLEGEKTVKYSIVKGYGGCPQPRNPIVIYTDDEANCRAEMNRIAANDPARNQSDFVDIVATYSTYLGRNNFYKIIMEFQCALVSQWFTNECEMSYHNDPHYGQVVLYRNNTEEETQDGNHIYYEDSHIKNVLSNGAALTSKFENHLNHHDSMAIGTLAASKVVSLDEQTSLSESIKFKLNSSYIKATIDSIGGLDSIATLNLLKAPIMTLVNNKKIIAKNKTLLIDRGVGIKYYAQLTTEKAPTGSIDLAFGGHPFGMKNIGKYKYETNRYGAYIAHFSDQLSIVNGMAEIKHEGQIFLMRENNKEYILPDTAVELKDGCKISMSLSHIELDSEQEVSSANIFEKEPDKTKTVKETTVEDFGSKGQNKIWLKDVSNLPKKDAMVKTEISGELTEKVSKQIMLTTIDDFKIGKEALVETEVEGNCVNETFDNISDVLNHSPLQREIVKEELTKQININGGTKGEKTITSTLKALKIPYYCVIVDNNGLFLNKIVRFGSGKIKFILFLNRYSRHVTIYDNNWLNNMFEADCKELLDQYNRKMDLDLIFNVLGYLENFNYNFKQGLRNYLNQVKNNK